MFFSFPRWFAPSVDGKVLPDTPENLLVQGRFSKVPFIVGQTKDEGAFFYRLVLNSFNNGQVRTLLVNVARFNTSLN
jgi:carboxylesterase type B